MEYIITVEETVCENFRIEASSPEEARYIAEKAYKNEDIVLAPGECIDVRFTVHENEEV